MTPKERAENYMRLKKGYKSSKDEFAIAFAEWAIDYSFNQMYSVDLKELLEEFKKENYDSRGIFQK